MAPDHKRRFPTSCWGVSPDSVSTRSSAFIPSRVVATSEETGRGLRIEFGEGAILVHPDFDDHTGPEIALLGGFKDGQWMCWRAGEECFEDLVRRGLLPR